MRDRRRELAEARAARERVEAESTAQLAEAGEVRADLSRRLPAINSVGLFLAARQRRNHFGAQLSLTLVPRRPRTP